VYFSAVINLDLRSSRHRADERDQIGVHKTRAHRDRTKLRVDGSLLNPTQLLTEWLRVLIHSPLSSSPLLS
jgi:hypothetical protein